MMPIAPSVGQSCVFFSQYRSSRMVNSSVKRRSAMNMGTFSPAVPAAFKIQGRPRRPALPACAQPHTQLCKPWRWEPRRTYEPAHHVHNVDERQWCNAPHVLKAELRPCDQVADGRDKAHLEERHGERKVKLIGCEDGLQKSST